MDNLLYYGDNLDILREHIPPESVDLIYLDPPFNSARNFNVLFSDSSGKPSEAQVSAFDDTWTWNEQASRTYHELVTQTSDEISQMIAAMRTLVKDGPMLAYLVMMTARLIEIHRSLKPTGSFYLHCDPTASHYLKLVLDCIFDPRNFRNEIIWKRTHSHGGAKRYGPVHDVIFFYTKSAEFTWNAQHTPYSEVYQKRFFRHEDADGKRYRLTILTGSGTRNGSSGKPWRGYDPTISGRHWAIPGYMRAIIGKSAEVQTSLDELDKIGRVIWPKSGVVPSFKQYLDDMEGVALQDIFNDVPPISAASAERLGYPTQKPLALLERIIKASSKPGDVVFDPFCGCGTTIAAAHKLDRQWIGIDITSLAIALIKNRMESMYPGLKVKTVGDPKDLASAQHLAREDRYQFQWWALSLIPARPLGGESGSKIGKKGSDKGIDGVVNFVDDATGNPKRVLVQVKSGSVKSGDIRDLNGTMQRENAAISVFVTLEEPSRDMKTEAASAGFYRSEGWQKDYPRMQILTVSDLLRGVQVQMPPAYGTFKQAQTVRNETKQGDLGL